MWPDRVSNPEPLALESDVLQTALRGPAGIAKTTASTVLTVHIYLVKSLHGALVEP